MPPRTYLILGSIIKGLAITILKQLNSCGELDGTGSTTFDGGFLIGSNRSSMGGFAHCMQRWDQPVSFGRAKQAIHIRMNSGLSIITLDSFALQKKDRDDVSKPEGVRDIEELGPRRRHFDMPGSFNLPLPQLQKHLLSLQITESSPLPQFRSIYLPDKVRGR